MRAEVVPTGLEEYGGVDNDGLDLRTIGHLGDLTLHAPAYPRVKDFVQGAAFCRIGKNDPAQALPIHGAVGQEYSLAPSASEPLGHLGQAKQIVPDRVAIDQRAAKPHQLGGHGALAGTDAADDSDNGFCR